MQTRQMSYDGFEGMASVLTARKSVEIALIEPEQRGRTFKMACSREPRSS